MIATNSVFLNFCQNKWLKNEDNIIFKLLQQFYKMAAREWCLFTLIHKIKNIPKTVPTPFRCGKPELLDDVHFTKTLMAVVSKK